jgi:large subunit ribosomal protein L10
VATPSYRGGLLTQTLQRFVSSGFFQKKGRRCELTLKKENKKLIAENLKERFSKSKVVIVTDYKGLDVMAINALRRKLREADIDYQVAKNTLLIRASEGTDVAVIKDYFVGPSAIAISYDDPVAPAKVLTDFAKENKKLEIKAGVIGEKMLDVADIKSLAALPSRDVLLGQVLSAMNGVSTAFVRVLNGVTGNFLNVLTAIKDQKEAE